jgi:ATP-binding cassette, subfamily B (MDR/TAP), member 1
MQLQPSIDRGSDVCLTFSLHFPWEDSHSFQRQRSPPLIHSSSMAVPEKKNDPKDKQQDTTPPSISDAFYFASPADYIYAFFGTLGAFLVGCSIPVFNVIFGRMLDNLNEGLDELQQSVNQVAVIFAIMAAGALIIGTLQVYCWSTFGERQTQKMREAYVRSILSQEVGWFDLNGAAEQSTKVADLCGKVCKLLSSRSSDLSSQVQDGLGRKAADFIQNLCQFFASFAVAFYISWRLSVSDDHPTPLLSLCSLIFSVFVSLCLSSLFFFLPFLVLDSVDGFLSPLSLTQQTML